MKSDGEKKKPRLLAGRRVSDNHYHIIRELTEAEETFLDERKSDVAKADERFSLFKILRRNFEEWSRHVVKLVSLESRDDDELEANRLLMNFLSSARAVIDHFRKYFSNVHKGTDKAAEFDAFLERLTKGSWTFAFFQDYRNYTQHSGLPICYYNKNVTLTSVKLEIHAPVAYLLKTENRWKYCTLDPSKGDIDLVDLARRYYIRLTRDFGTFVAKSLGPHLAEAHEFLKKLSNEVQKATSPGHQLFVMHPVESKGNKHRINGYSRPVTSSVSLESNTIQDWLRSRRVPPAFQRGSPSQFRSPSLGLALSGLSEIIRHLPKLIPERL